MTKFEDKILEWLKSKRIIIGFIFVTVLNLFLRKIAVWWTVEGVVSYYDGHDHMVQGMLWWLLMRAGMLFPILPVHFMKWVSAAGDFAMAACGALALYRGPGTSEKSAERSLVFYAVALIMPFTLLRGIVWSMTDSFGIACFLWAYSFGRKKDLLRIVFYALGMLFSPALILVLFAEAASSAFGRETGKKTAGPKTGFGAALCAVCLTALTSGFLGVINGFGFLTGIFGQVNFLSYDALTGLSFESGIPWLIQMLWLYCLPVSVWGLFRLFSAHIADEKRTQ